MIRHKITADNEISAQNRSLIASINGGLIPIDCIAAFQEKHPGLKWKTEINLESILYHEKQISDNVSQDKANSAVFIIGKSVHFRLGTK